MTAIHFTKIGSTSELEPIYILTIPFDRCDYILLAATVYAVVFMLTFDRETDIKRGQESEKPSPEASTRSACSLSNTDTGTAQRKLVTLV